MIAPALLSVSGEIIKKNSLKKRLEHAEQEIDLNSQVITSNKKHVACFVKLETRTNMHVEEV